MMHSGKFLEALKKLTGVKVVCKHCARKDPQCARAEKQNVYGKSKVLKRQNEIQDHR